MNICVVFPLKFHNVPWLYPPLHLLNNCGAQTADAAIVVVEDESRWALDENSFRIIVERRIPTAFLDVHDYYTYLLCDSGILSQCGFLSPRWAEYQSGNKLNRIRWFHHELVTVGIPTIHFKIWKFDKQEGVFPYTPCVSHVQDLVSFDQFCSREYDVVTIANKFVSREDAVKVLRQAPLRSLFHLYDAVRPMNFNEWVSLHGQSRMFLEVCAGAQGTARPFELGTVSLMLKQRDRVHWPEPFKWTHNESCIEMGKPTVPITMEDVEEIIPIVRDRERLYQLYKNCHAKTLQFSPENIAAYVKKTIVDNLPLYGKCEP